MRIRGRRRGSAADATAAHGLRSSALRQGPRPTTPNDAHAVPRRRRRPAPSPRTFAGRERRAIAQTDRGREGSPAPEVGCEQGAAECGAAGSGQSGCARPPVCGLGRPTRSSGQRVRPPDQTRTLLTRDAHPLSLPPPGASPDAGPADREEADGKGGPGRKEASRTGQPRSAHPRWPPPRRLPSPLPLH